MMLMLSCARRMGEQRANLERGEFWHPWTNELAEKRLLLLGVGASGRELARRAASFQMDIIGVDTVVEDQESYRRIGIASVKSPEALSELLPTADVISLHLPLTNETHHILDAEALEHAETGRDSYQRGSRCSHRRASAQQCARRRTGRCRRP